MHLCTCMSEEGGDGESACSETSSLMSYTLRDVSFKEVDNVCRVALREPMHLCTYVSEKVLVVYFQQNKKVLVVYYESIKRDRKRRRVSGR